MGTIAKYMDWQQYISIRSDMCWCESHLFCFDSVTCTILPYEARPPALKGEMSPSTQGPNIIDVGLPQCFIIMVDGGLFEGKHI
jgi:hypothetical protein